MSMLRLMYVEDEPDIRMITRLTLENIGGHEVIEATSGVEALALLRQVQPDMILLDVMMPIMNGPETYRKIREIPALRNTPVIFMTAKVQAHEIDAYIRMGAAGVIAKPFDPMTLCQKVAELWESSNHARSSRAG